MNLTEVRTLKPGDWIIFTSRHLPRPEFHAKILAVDPPDILIEWEDRRAGWNVVDIYSEVSDGFWSRVTRHPDYPETELTDEQWIDKLAQEGKPEP